MNTLASESFSQGGETLAEQAVERVRRAILSGALAPGSKLHILKLAAEFGLSATPMREALTRLLSYGLVEASGQKGFRVIPMSLRDLEDIQRMRHMVEVEALSLAIANGDLEWEARIASALYRLKSLSEAERDRQPEGEPLFDAAHKEFHAALLSGCGSPRLLALHSELHDQVYRYRIVLCVRRRPKDDTDSDHEALARHVLARNLIAAKKALHQHIELTTRGVQKLTRQALRAAFTDADIVSSKGFGTFVAPGRAKSRLAH